MKRGFSLEAPGATARCHCCGKYIQKGEPAILLETFISRHSGRLFFHIACFPEKSDIQ